jgi:hypothetical protein
MSYQQSYTDQQILRATSMMTTYGGLGMFTLGLLGNTMNVVAFSCLKVYRSLATSAFLVTASLCGQFYLTFSLLIYALSNVLEYNPAARYKSLCRATLYIPKVTMQISLTCLCLSAIDRYLMTSRSARQRAWMTPQRARLLVCACVVIWCAVGVPNAILALNYAQFNICVPTVEYAAIVTYLNLAIAIVVPIGTLCIFGFLTWKNLNRAHLSTTNLQVVCGRSFSS